jgi:hypothetical protein
LGIGDFLPHDHKMDRNPLAFQNSPGDYQKPTKAQPATVKFRNQCFCPLKTDMRQHTCWSAGVTIARVEEVPGSEPGKFSHLLHSPQFNRLYNVTAWWQIFF